MHILVLTTIIIVGILTFVLMAVPSNITPSKASNTALDNVSHWFNSKFGPNWPIMLSIFIIFCFIIFGLLTKESQYHVIHPTHVTGILKVLTIFTVGVSTLVLWNIYSPGDNKGIYYILALMLGMNIYLVSK